MGGAIQTGTAIVGAEQRSRCVEVCQGACFALVCLTLISLSVVYQSMVTRPHCFANQKFASVENVACIVVCERSYKCNTTYRYGENVIMMNSSVRFDTVVFGGIILYQLDGGGYIYDSNCGFLTGAAVLLPILYIITIVVMFVSGAHIAEYDDRILKSESLKV